MSPLHQFYVFLMMISLVLSLILIISIWLTWPYLVIWGGLFLLLLQITGAYAAWKLHKEKVLDYQLILRYLRDTNV